MPRKGVCPAVTILLLLIGVVCVAAVPTVQVARSALRRQLYGAARPKFFPEYLDDREISREEADARLVARQPSRPWGDANRTQARSSRDENRAGRNLDQIGGGNLLRRGLGGEEDSATSEDRRWSRRNLDQIGGGNLLRDADDRAERNLDHIGGGNLVRDLHDPSATADELCGSCFEACPKWPVGAR